MTRVCFKRFAPRHQYSPWHLFSVPRPIPTPQNPLMAPSCPQDRLSNVWQAWLGLPLLCLTYIPNLEILHSLSESAPHLPRSPETSPYLPSSFSIQTPFQPAKIKPTQPPPLVRQLSTSQTVNAQQGDSGQSRKEQVTHLIVSRNTKRSTCGIEASDSVNQ